MFRRKTKDERQENVILPLNLFQGKDPVPSTLRATRGGVSLITVLLFMLVATIAATATYKWITSEGRSSSSRMLEREAYQSSVAGIESAISWMTYHANDVGALIRQYKTNGKKAVSLDDQLAELVRPGQNFHVWLTGVSTEPYKLKLVSEGVARNGKASHSEVAILDVDGLYRVKLPTTTSSINFDKAFQGDLGNLTNSPTFESAIVNGNFSGNQPNVTTSMIVTGNVDLAGPKSGASGLAGADLYVGGKLVFNGNNRIGSADNVVYVGGEFSCENGTASIYIGGDLYVHGNIHEKCGVYTKGNLTANGIFYRTSNTPKAVDGSNNDCKKYDNDLSVCVEKNLVFTENGQYDISGSGKGAFWVGKNWYAPARIEAHCNNGAYGNSSDCGDFGGGRKSVLDGEMYKYNSTAYNKYYVVLQQGKNVTKDGVTTWESGDPNYGIYMQNTTQSSLGNNTEADNSRKKRLFGLSLTDGTKIKTSPAITSWARDDAITGKISDSYWSNYDKMMALKALIDETGTKKAVPQAILLKNMKDGEDLWLKNQSNTKCHSLSGLSNLKASMGGESDSYIIQKNSNQYLNVAFWKDVQECYDKLSQASDLYNGYLVLVFKGDEDTRTPITSDGTNSGNPVLNGNFVFYYTGKISANQYYIPPTSKTSSILLYLKGGVNHLYSGGPLTEDPDAGKFYYNYFIYAAGSSSFSNLKVNGSVVMENGTSATVENEKVNLKYNAAVLQALADAGFIEENSEYTKRAGKVTSSGGVSFAGGGSFDEYYIATAPQLSITIESQYANNESINNIANNEQDAKGAFIVLPRIIYLSRTPVGSLDQYYNIIPLVSRVVSSDPTQNKTVSPVVNPSVTCDGIPASGDLVLTNNHKLTPGNYTCNVTGTVAGTESTVPFYVVVSGGGSTEPEVTFEEGLKDLKQTDEAYDVKLKIPVSTSPADYNVIVSFPDFSASEWDVQAQMDGGADCHKNGVCTFTIRSNKALHPIFKVENKGASHQLVFQIMDANGGCGVGTPSMETIVPSTKIEVERKSLKDWCKITANSGDSRCSRKDDPECSDISSEWITASGCSYTIKNQKWSCKNTGTVSLEPVSSGVPDGCEVVIPPGNKLEAPFNELETLYASLFSKPFTFTAGFSAKTGTGANLSGDQIIHIAVYRKDKKELESDCYYKYLNDSEKYAEFCQVGVYYGDKVTLTLNPEEPATFNYWMCESGADCPSPKVPDPSYTHTVVVTGDNKVNAHFDEKDKHCFFDEFRNRGVKYANRSEILCSNTNTETEYCIGTDGTSKWNLQSGNASDIEFAGDGRISLKSSATRGKKEDSKGSVTIMSTVKAGIYGTLKAQFQVPREEISSGDISKSTVKQSGFILRSNASVSKYLMLNVFSDKNDKLKARICLDGGTICKDAQIGNATAHQEDIILIAAILQKNEDTGDDELVINAYTNAFSSSYDSHKFVLTQENLDGVQNLASQSNESVGFRLSNQNFKIYGIGWTSEDYKSECWDTSPTITCSFKAAYPGGIVPRSDLPETGYRKPWVGFSKWFDDNGANCTPTYYYNGSDAGCSYGTMGSSYQTCAADGYYFSGNESEGVHGVGDVKVARAGASGTNCNISGEEAPWVNSTGNADIAAHCGAFWVGKQSICKKHAKFEQTVNNGDEGTYFGIKPPDQGNYSLPIVANLRKAELIVEMDNTSGSEVEIYLFSKNTDLGGTYGYGMDYVYSMPYTTNVSGTVTIDVDAISHVEGFDPENVVGVYVKGESISVTSVRSNCPYALSLAGCSATYDPANDKWKVTATVNGREDAGTLNVSSVTIGGSTTKTVSGASKTCNKEPSDCVSGKTQTWETIWGSSKDDGLPYISDEHTPYYYLGSNSSVNYVFTVTLTDANGDVAEGSGSPCEEVKVSEITASCERLDKYKVNQGQGIPQLKYSITGCPAAGTPQTKKCGYEVDLYKGSVKKATVKSIDNFFGSTSGSWSGVPDDINTADDMLPVGDDYKLVLKSTNSEYPFTSSTCVMDNSEITFEVKEAGSQSETYQADCWWEVGNTEVDQILEGYGEATFKIKTKKGFPSNTTGTLELDGETTTVDLYENGKTSNKSNYGSIPKTAKSYDYSVLYSGEVVCSGSIEIVKPLTCDIKNKPPVYNQDNYFVVTKSSLISGNCWEPSCTGTSGTCSCEAGEIPFSMDVVSKTLSITCKCPGGVQASCSAPASVNIVAPTLPEGNCVDAKINAEPSTNTTISFSTTLGNCETGCTYFVENANGDKRTPETDGTIYNGTNITFSAEEKTGDNTYTLYVKNSKNETASCTIPVNYRVPSYSCPGAITAEPGTQVTVTPVLGSPSYCSGGCDYKITGTGIDDIEGENFTSVPLADKIVDASDPITGTAVTGGVAKKYSLTLSNAAGSGAACDVTVNYMKPTFTCPGPKEVAVNTDVTVSPTGVSYCTKGCSYTISGGSFDNVTGTTGNNYTGGALSNKITGESTATASGSDGMEYTLTLHNPAGDNATACKFKVKYKEKPTGCTCIAWVNGTGDYYKNCYSSGLRNMNEKCYTLNPERKADNPQWITDDASNSHWWSVVSCTEWTGCSGGGSGGGGDEGINWTNNTTLEAGTHTIAKCNGYTGTKTTQITASFANCWDAFSATTGAGYWNNMTGNCNGQASVTYPVTVTVPSGGTLTLSNCY